MEEKMTTKDALVLVDRLLAGASGTRADHEQIVIAIAVLRTALEL